jgi:hypothetical protein
MYTISKWWERDRNSIATDCFLNIPSVWLIPNANVRGEKKNACDLCEAHVLFQCGFTEERRGIKTRGAVRVFVKVTKWCCIRMKACKVRPLSRCGDKETETRITIIGALCVTVQVKKEFAAHLNWLRAAIMQRLHTWFDGNVLRCSTIDFIPNERYKNAVFWHFTVYCCMVEIHHESIPIRRVIHLTSPNHINTIAAYL